MVRCVSTASIWLVLVAACVAYAARGQAQPLVFAEPDLALAVNLRVPKEERLVKLSDIMNKAKARGATHLTMNVSSDGEGISAEVVAQPQTPSKRVAAVVGELLDCGIKKISVEVKN